MDPFQIKEATPEDAQELEAISRKIFYDSFHDQNTEENILAYMDHAYHPDKLMEELHDPNVEYYFLCDHDRKIGYLKLNYADSQSDIGDPDSLEIERIYVDQAYQCKGLGAVLLEKAKTRAKEKRLRYVWLGVWEKNPRAIRFYERHGFMQFGSHQFIMGDEVQTDILMKKDL
jgi:ribosomal protein S18 acetylase RimI-like enzyme